MLSSDDLNLSKAVEEETKSSNCMQPYQKSRFQKIKLSYNLEQTINTSHGLDIQYQLVRTKRHINR